MTRLRNNIIANFCGRFWSTAMGIAFVPVYIHILGIEAYGLIGFFLSLQAFFFILDIGLSATISRELARYRHTGGNADEQRDLVRTLELIYWPMALVIGVLVFAISKPLANDWLRPVSLSSDQTAHAITLMGIAAALQWPTGFYSGGFTGLERQVALNGLGALFATLRNVGAVIVIVYLSPTIEGFLWWQAAISALQTSAYAIILWHTLPSGSRRPVFRGRRLEQLLPFTLGMIGISALSFLLRQSDKLILSGLLPLSEFGYYALAATVAAALSNVIQPIFNALYPRYSGLIAAGLEGRLTLLYHQSNELLAVLVGSSAAMLVFFATDILRLWTRDALLAAKSGEILAILAVGSALNGLMNLPYALQLAYGWTRLALYQNIAATLVVVPATWWLAKHFGGMGAAYVWVALNMSYILVGIPLMHRKLLTNEMTKWYLDDILPPVLGAVLIAALARFIIPISENRVFGVGTLGIIGAIVLATATQFSSSGRMLQRRFIAHLRP